MATWFVSVWGLNSSGQCNVPAPNSGFIFASGSAGNGHSLGLKADGSIVAWGRNTEGQCTIPSGNSGYVVAAAGEWHSLGLKSDGSISAWGLNTNGQCTIPSGNSGYVAVDGGGSHSLGLKSSGSITAWGYNGYGQCTIPSGNSGFVAVAAGGLHSLGLKSSGSITAWGYNGYGQCTIPTPNSGFTAVSCGWCHSLGLKSSGSIVAFGWNDNGQGLAPPSNSGFVAIAAGFYHNLGLKSNGSITAWGDNTSGQIVVPSNSGYVSIAAGGCHSLGFKEGASVSGAITLYMLGVSSRSIVVWGSQTYGQWNIPAPNCDFIAVARGNEHCLGLKASGSIVAWGRNSEGQCNVPAPNSGFVAIAAGIYHSLGLKSSGSIVAWGYNTSSQCSVPAPNSGFIAMAGGQYHSLGLKLGGSIVGWGDNTYGQRTYPVASGANSGYIAISADLWDSIAVHSNGSLVAWGADPWTPVPNSGFIGAVSIGRLYMALKASGSFVSNTALPSPNSGFVRLAPASMWTAKRTNGFVQSWSTTNVTQSGHFGDIAWDMGIAVCDVSGTNTLFVRPKQSIAGTCPVMLCGGIVRTLGVYLYCSGVAYDGSSTLYARGHLPLSGSSTIFMRGNVLQEMGVTASGHGYDLWWLSTRHIYAGKTNRPDNYIQLPDRLADLSVGTIVGYDLPTGRLIWTDGTTVRSSGAFNGASGKILTATFPSFDPYDHRVYALSGGTTICSYNAELGDGRTIKTIPITSVPRGVIADVANDYIYVPYDIAASGGYPIMRMRISNPSEWTMVVSGSAVLVPYYWYDIDRILQKIYCAGKNDFRISEADLVTGGRYYVMTRRSVGFGVSRGRGASGLVDVYGSRPGIPQIVWSLASPSGYENPVTSQLVFPDGSAPLDVMVADSEANAAPRFTCFVTGPRSKSLGISCTIRGGRYPDNDGVYQGEMRSYWPCDDRFEYISQMAGSGSRQNIGSGNIDSTFGYSSSGTLSLIASGNVPGLINCRAICPIGESGFFLIGTSGGAARGVFYGMIDPGTAAISGVKSSPQGGNANVNVRTLSDGLAAWLYTADWTNPAGYFVLTPTATGYVQSSVYGPGLPYMQLSGRRVISFRGGYYDFVTLGFMTAIWGTGLNPAISGFDTYGPFSGTMPYGLPYPTADSFDGTNCLWTVSTSEAGQRCGLMSVSGVVITFGPMAYLGPCFVHGSSGPGDSKICSISSDTAIIAWLKMSPDYTSRWVAVAVRRLADNTMKVGPVSEYTPWLDGFSQIVPLGLGVGASCGYQCEAMVLNKPTVSGMSWSRLIVDENTLALSVADTVTIPTSGTCYLAHNARGDYHLGCHSSGVLVFRNNRVLTPLPLTRAPSGVAAKSLTVSVWSSGTLNSSGTIRVSDGFVHEFTSSGMRLTGASGSIWAPSPMSGVASDQWHMTMASWHPSGALSYTPRISVDGEAWVTLEPTGTVSGVTTGGMASLSGTVPNSVTGAALDEVVVWSRTNPMEDQVLENLYNLGSSGYQVVEYHNFFEHDQASGSATLFVRGHLSIAESSVAYTLGGFPSADCSGTVYVRGHEPLDSSGVAYLCGSELASGTGTAYVLGHEFVDNASILYMRGHESTYGVTTIYLAVPEPASNSGVAYLRGHEPVGSSSISYLRGHEPIDSSGTVYLRGHGPISYDCTCVILSAHEVTSNDRSIYLRGHEPLDLSITEYVRGHEPVDSSGVAYLRGHEPLDGSVTVYMRGHEQPGLLGSLYVRGHEPVDSSGVAYLRGHEPLDADSTVYLRGHEPLDDSDTAYLRGHEPLDGDITIYVRGHESPDSLGTLYLRGHEPLEEDTTVYLRGHEPLDDDITAHLHGYEPFDTSCSMYLRGHEPLDSSGVAYLRGHEPIGGNRPCVILYAHEVVVDDRDLYLRGHEPIDSDTTVYMRGHEAPGSLGTLYLRGHEPLDGDTVAYLRGHEPVDASGSVYMRGRMPAGKLPFDDNVVFYHECDDLIEFTHDQTWDGTTVVDDGKILSALVGESSLDASSPSVYPSTTSATRLTVGLWCMNPSVGGSLITAGASLSASISGSTVWMNSARWSVPALSSLNDDQWHFVVLDFVNSADGWWTLGASIDGSALDPIGIQDAGYVPLPVAPVSPGLSVAGDTTRIDEVIVWRNLSRLDSVDLVRLYSLAETYDQPFSVYRDYFDDYATQSMDCYLAADTFAVGTTTLVIRGPIATSGDTTVFVGAYEVFSGSCTLAFHHPSIATYTAPCFLKVPEPIEVSTTACLWGNESINSNCPCVLPKANDVLASGCTAVLCGHESLNRPTSAYLRGHAVAGGNCTCVLADVHGVVSGVRTAHIVGFVPADDSLDMFIRSHEVVLGNRSAYIHGPTAISGDTTTFVGAYDVLHGTCTLAFHFPSIATYTSPCFLKVPEPAVQNCPLVMVGREPITSTKTCVLVGHESTSPAGTLYERGHKVVVATMPLMLQSPGLASGTTSLYMSTKTVGVGTTTAMIRGSISYPTKVWWCDASNPLNVVHSKRVNGDDPWVVSSGVGDPRGITVNIESGFLFWTNSAPFSAITRSELDGRNRTNILSGVILPMAMDIDTYGDKVYWTDTVTNKIMSCGLDGSNVTTVVAMTGASDPVGLRYYHPERALFFADRADGTIKRFNIRTGILRTIVTVGTDVARVDIDPVKRRIYWSMQYPTDKIMSCTFMGGAVQELYGDSDGYGVLLAWGYDGHGTLNIPASAFGASDISCGGIFVLALRNDGAIVGWGQNQYGQCDPPLPNSGFVSVSAGYGHSLAIRSDSSVEFWGNTVGSGSPGWGMPYSYAIPSPNSGFISVAAGGFHCLGLRSNGSVVAWGDNFYGQCTVPSGHSGFIAIGAGAYHSLGLKTNGTVVAWGRNDYGQCTVPENSGYSKIVGGFVHSMGLKTNGSIRAWGNNSLGQRTVPVPNNHFVDLAAGSYFSYGLKDDGSLRAWGNNARGQCSIPTPNGDFTDVFSCGFDFVVATRFHGVSDPMGVAVDWKNKMLYWANRGTSDIMRGSLLASGIVEVFASGFGAGLDGVALDVPEDPAAGYTWALSDLAGSFDNAPQLVGNLDYVGTSGEVTIKVWRLDHDGPVEVTPVGGAGCYPIGDTGRWAWSTAGLPVASNVRTMYYYEMYASSGSVFKGEFVWQTRPDSKVSKSRRRRRKEK